MNSPSSSLVDAEELFCNLSDRTAILTLFDQPYNADMESPNDMLVDSEEFLNDADGEKDDGDVAIINPDEAPPRGDDCTYSSNLWKL
jgi:hypothetical protein